ncbi:MAG: hypothetical protein E4H24_06875, partial [Thermomicrobiales bacterium]
MNQDLILVIIVVVLALVAAIAAVGAAMNIEERRRSAGAPVTGFRGVIDRSIGMYFVRRVLRRPIAPDLPPPTDPALSPDEISYRIGVAGA